MGGEISLRFESSHSPAANQVLLHLQDIRAITFAEKEDSSAFLSAQGFLKQLQSLSEILLSAGFPREAGALSDVYNISTLSTDFGGLGHEPDAQLDQKEETEVLFLVSAWLEALNSADRSKSPVNHLSARPEGRRPMTLSEKIFAAHDIDRKGEVKPGDVVRVNVDWIMASELSWMAMERAYMSLGKPGIFRNDRFWLAGDHVVDPRIKNMPQVKALVSASERAREQFRMTEYQGMNYTIMHTEFCRERAQPGMLVIGSDSHTCSAGSVGALAIGLGVADVTMPLITGESWFRIPESVNIRLINAPSIGIGGKDTILYIMKELKRNTVAADRVIEFTGPGLEHLSCDARFAISNMTTEFGGVSGIFVPDQVTFDFVNRRKSPRHKRSSDYFRPDEDAKYAATHVIDLAQVESFVARYPSPDDVVPVSELEGTSLDGCFIGACTTAEEDLILGAMVLEVGMQKGLVPLKQGKRKVVPGSMPILNRLKTLGFTNIYTQAGFEIGVPGCSYCVGMGADRAGEGEVWISSQNRNFKNRMGQGSIGHLGSAATVAASSFGMKITDPRPFLDAINQSRLNEILGRQSNNIPKHSPVYIEPGQGSSAPIPELRPDHDEKSPSPAVDRKIAESPSDITPSIQRLNLSDVRRGKVQRLGDFIDTDALAPAEILTSCTTNEEFGQHCLKHTHPNFRSRAKDGYNVVVAGHAFGCGSSRENAVNALLGTGVICVIAKSFAFIYGRNQPNLGLLGITITDETFHEAAVEGANIEIDLDRFRVRIEEREWSFEFSLMEKELIQAGGLSNAFLKFGTRLFEVMCTPKKVQPGDVVLDDSCGNTKGLEW